jgi:dTDP-4-amino-4,6-dideoxygalactose transaminase
MESIVGDSSRFFFFENARSGLYVFLKSLGLKKGAKVAVQGFTCNAAVNPILWAGLSPTYIDIDPWTFNMSLDDLKRKYSKDMKAVIVQHTFGNAAEIQEIVKWAHENNIIVVEDCAHSLGVKYKGKILGTWGDAAIFSFGLEKVLSTRAGGVLAVNNDSLAASVQQDYNELKTMSFFDTFLWLINPLIWRVLRITGGLQMKIAAFLNKLGILNMGFYKKELIGKKPDRYARKLPNALAKVALGQLEDLHQNIKHRKDISKLYHDSLCSVVGLGLYKRPDKEVAFDPKADKDYVVDEIFPCVRFPFLCKDTKTRNNLRTYLESRGIYVGDWYDPVIYPESTDLEAFGYEDEMCPYAEQVSGKILNIPTGMNVCYKDAKIMAEIVRQFLGKVEYED